MGWNFLPFNLSTTHDKFICQLEKFSQLLSLKKKCPQNTGAKVLFFFWPSWVEQWLPINWFQSSIEANYDNYHLKGTNSYLTVGRKLIIKGRLVVKTSFLLSRMISFLGGIMRACGKRVFILRMATFWHLSDSRYETKILTILAKQCA